MSATDFFRVGRSELRQLRALALNMLPHLEWRHHSIGVLQAYLWEGDKEVRVHIWHSNLLVNGMEHSGQVHDHRFTLESTVLVGRIQHDEIRLRENDDGPWQMFEITNARHAQAKREFKITPVEGRYDARVIPHTVHSGERYTFQKRAFHRSAVDELTITIVTKHDQEDRWARILAPYGSDPVHGFGKHKPVDPRLYVDAARHALHATLEGQR